jgi:putative transposase
MVTPAARREVVSFFRDQFERSERSACELSGVCRSMVRYRRRQDETNQKLRLRLIDLAAERPRFGYRRLYFLVDREGWGVNIKRVYRLYRLEGLAVRRKKRKKVAQANRRPRVVPQRLNEQWSMDFMRDTLADSRSFRMLNVLDEASRECLAIEADTSLSGQRVCRVLDGIAAGRGYPLRIVVDNGPEFTSIALDQWAYQHKVELAFIRPGKPIENCIVESFNGRLRDECLNLHWFTSLADARSKLERWRLDYNLVRPHGALGGLPPALFAEGAGLQAAAPPSAPLPEPIPEPERSLHC